MGTGAGVRVTARAAVADGDGALVDATGEGVAVADGGAGEAVGDGDAVVTAGAHAPATSAHATTIGRIAMPRIFCVRL